MRLTESIKPNCIINYKLEDNTEKLEQILNAGALSSDINIEKLELEIDQLLTESTDRVLRTRIKEVNYRDAREYCKKSK